MKVRINEDLTPHSSWHKKVYAPNKGMNKYENVEWKAIVKIVKKRDKYVCKSCGLKLGLTVHHIRPRDEDGTDYPSNLITLCNNCHNEVETLGLRDKWQIIDLKQKRKYIKGRTINETIPTHWQQWVYGGYKKP